MGAKMPSAESIELSVGIDAGDTLAVLNNINKNIEKMATTTQDSESQMKKSGNVFSKTLGDIKLGWLAVAGAIGTFTKFLGESINEAIDGARAQVTLNNALRNVGLQYKDIETDIKRISEINAVDDDDVKKWYSYAIALGVPKQRLSEFIETAYNFSAATGKDLSMAMRSLTADVIKGGDAWDKQKLAVEGAGKAAADADGGIKKMSVAYKDLQQAIGQPIVMGFSGQLERTNKIINDTTESSNKWGYAIYTITSGIFILLNLLVNVPKMLSSIGDRLAGVFQQIGNSIKIMFLEIEKSNPFTRGDQKQEIIKNIEYLKSQNETLKEKNAISKENAQQDIKNLTTIMTYEEYVEKKNKQQIASTKTILDTTKMTTEELKKLYDSRMEFENALTKDLKTQLGDRLGLLDDEKKAKIKTLKELYSGTAKYAELEAQINAYYEEEKRKEKQKTFDMALQGTQTLTNSLQGMFDQYYANQLVSAEGDAEKTKQIKRDQFNANKAFATVNSIINTAEAVSKTLATFGFPIGAILGAAVGVAGAIQTALIASQPMPAFAKGGIIPGNSFTGDQIMARVNSGEGVFTKEQMAAMAPVSKSNTQYNFNGPILANDPVEFFRKIQIQIKRAETSRGIG